MAVTTTQTNKPLNPRGNDQSPKGYNRAELYSGKALDFDGVNDLVTTANNLPFTSGSDLSIVSYFKIDDSNEGYFYQNSAIYLAVYRDGSTAVGELSGFVSGSWLDTGYIVNDSKWYQVAQIIDNGTQRIYLNGQEIATQSGVSYNPSSQTVLNIGKRDSNYLNGQMANVKAFSTALTAAQVADLYNNPEKVVPTGVDNTALKLWLPMQEGAGTTAYDGSGNGNHGTISGASWLHGIGAPVSQTAVIDWNKSHNYIDKSEEFETGFWSENRLVTITDDSFIAPDGSATATEIVETTANDTHFLAQTLSVTAGDYFISAYVKKRDYDWVQLSTGGDISRYANFNISTGATGNASGISDLVIQDKGNGWYRIGGKLTTSATSFNYFITLIQSDVASRFQTYTGTDKGQYIWGAQATKSSTLQPYLRNIGTSAITDDVLLPQGLTSSRDITGVNLFENVRKQGALNLDGNSWAEVHDNGSLDFGTGDFTLEAWAKLQYTNTGSSVNAILSIGTISALTLIGMNNPSSIVALVNGTGAYEVATIGDWAHIVLTKEGTSCKLYVDATNTDTFTKSADITNTENKYLGSDSTTIRYYKDQIAQPRIYNRALTAEEVERNYNAGKNIYTNS